MARHLFRTDAPPSGEFGSHAAWETDAGQWVAAGFEEGEGRTWLGFGFSRDEADTWRRGGFTPSQANFMLLVLACALVADDATPDASLPSCWQRSGLPAWWACVCVAAGVLHIGSATDLFQLHHSDPRVLGELLRRGRARGVDPLTLRVRRGPVSGSCSLKFRAQCLWLRLARR